MNKMEGTALLEQVRKIPIKYANTKDNSGNDRNVKNCPLFEDFNYCFDNHQEVIDFDNVIRVDYRRCNVFKLINELNKLRI